MAVLGIDIGSLNSVIATVGKGVVNVIRNEISERLTPSLVGFTEHERLIGDAAMAQIKSHYRSTCRNMKNLLGRTVHDLDICFERSFSLTPFASSIPNEPNSEIGYVLDSQYKHFDSNVFSASHVYAMLLGRLKADAYKSTGHQVVDVVIGTPTWFTDSNREAVLRASRIAGLNCVRIIPENVAIALDYGIFRQHEFHETEYTTVAFVAIGHANASVSIVEYIRGEVKIVAEAGSRNLGGRNIDLLMIEKCAAHFQSQTGIDISDKPLARLKLEEVCRRAKTMLSVNSDAPINIECLVGDHDFYMTFSRADLEALCGQFKDQLTTLMQECVGDRGIDKIVQVEIAGGCTRMPIVQQCIKDFFGRPVCKTLNMDECVARGCALQAVKCSSSFRTLKIEIAEKNKYSISLGYFESLDPHSSELQEKSAVLFARGCPINVSKFITFNRRGPFTLLVKYSDFSAGAPWIEPFLGKFLVNIPESSTDQMVRVKVRLDANGMFILERAQILEEHMVETTVMERRLKTRPASTVSTETACTTSQQEPVVPSTTSTTESSKNKTEQQSETQQSGNPPEEFEEVPVMKMTKKQKQTDVPITRTLFNSWLPPDLLPKLIEIEQRMCYEDKVCAETKEMLNLLEGLVFETMRNLSPGGSLHKILSSEANEALYEKFRDAENWLLDYPDCEKSVYEQKLMELKSLVPQVPVPIQHENTESDSQDTQCPVSNCSAEPNSDSGNIVDPDGTVHVKVM